MGMSAIGSSVGGTVFPIAAQNLIPEVGYVWHHVFFGTCLLFLPDSSGRCAFLDLC